MRPESPEALWASIVQVLGDPKLLQALAEGARARYLAHYTLERQCSELISLFAGLRAGCSA